MLLCSDIIKYQTYGGGLGGWISQQNIYTITREITVCFQLQVNMVFIKNHHHDVSLALTV